MRLLDRYLLRELMIPFGYCLGGFMIFWISFDLFSEIGDFQSKHLLASDIAEYYLVKTPEMLSLILPVAFLLALLYSLTNHARHNELTAARAAGVSLWRLSLPYFAVGLLFSLALFAMNEIWVPRSLEASEDILNRHQKASDALKDWKRNLYFRNEAEQRYWTAQFYNLQARSMSNVNLQCYFPDGSRRDLYGDRVVWSNGVWHFFGVKDWAYKAVNDPLPVPVEKAQAQFNFPETPQIMKSEIKITNLSGMKAARRPRLSIQEIRNYFQLHPKVSRSQANILGTQLHGRIAAPWTCLVIVLIALPFGAPSGRRNVFVGVAASVFICFAYFILLRLGLVLGTGGWLPGWLAAWLPNLLFGLGGVILTARVR